MEQERKQLYLSFTIILFSVRVRRRYAAKRRKQGKAKKLDAIGKSKKKESKSAVGS